MVDLIEPIELHQSNYDKLYHFRKADDRAQNE